MSLSTFSPRAICILALSVLTLIPLGAAPAQNSGDLRYLLIRRAGTPEKNYYEFARRVVGILDSAIACTRSTKLGWCGRRIRKNNRLRRRTVRLFLSIAAIQT